MLNTIQIGGESSEDKEIKGHCSLNMHADDWWPRAFRNSSFKSWLHMLYDTVPLFFFHLAILLSCAQNAKNKTKNKTALTSIYC